MQSNLASGIVAIAGLIAERTSSLGLAPWLGQKAISSATTHAMVGPLTPPKSDAFTMIVTPVVNSISSARWVDNHAPESGHVVDNRLHVTENNPGLLFISSETHDGESFTDRDEWLEVDEAGDEAGGQGRYEGFPATTTNDEICFLGAA